MNSQPIILPSIQLRWDVATLSSGGVFVQYDIYRRGAGEATWTRIATIGDIATVSYADYCVASGVTYEYAVTQEENISGDVIESTKQDPPITGRVLFNWAYLHAVNDPTQYVVFFSLDAAQKVEQDVTTRAAWGRTAPTAFIGELDYSTLRLTGLADVLLGSVWATRPIASLQRTAAAIYCLRLGAARERFYVNITSLSRRIGQKQYEPEMDATEVAYDEAV